MRRRPGDLVLSVRIHEKQVWFYVVVEHQRKIDPLMVVRMGIYIMRLYDEMMRANHLMKKVPLIVPLLVHRSRTGWEAKARFQDVVNLDEAMRQDAVSYIPHYEMRVVDLHPPSPATLERSVLTTYGKIVLTVLEAAGDEADCGRYSRSWARRSPRFTALPRARRPWRRSNGTLLRRSRSCSAAKSRSS